MLVISNMQLNILGIVLFVVPLVFGIYPHVSRFKVSILTITYVLCFTTIMAVYILKKQDVVLAPRYGYDAIGGSRGVMFK